MYFLRCLRPPLLEKLACLRIITIHNKFINDSVRNTSALRKCIVLAFTITVHRWHFSLVGCLRPAPEWVAQVVARAIHGAVATHGVARGVSKGAHDVGQFRNCNTRLAEEVAPVRKRHV